MNNSIRTQQFLRHVSRRLSGREDCKKVEFMIGIGYRFPGANMITSPHILDDKYIFFHPNIDVYKDKHHRKEVDLNGIVDHTIYKFYPDLILGYDLFGSIIVDTSKFIRGVYQYQLSVDGKRRRWVRRNEFVIDDARKSKQFHFTNFRRDDE